MYRCHSPEAEAVWQGAEAYDCGGQSSQVPGFPHVLIEMCCECLPPWLIVSCEANWPLGLCILFWFVLNLLLLLLFSQDGFWKEALSFQVCRPSWPFCGRESCVAESELHPHCALAWYSVACKAGRGTGLTGISMVMPARSYWRPALHTDVSIHSCAHTAT